ncbi:MAG: hypothetical protein C0596_01040 [Marinilabiliales bacterium]|nr:MAG: hypothetical protein C0596_01040 [Marinilabiliales bacterium]
MYVGSATAFNHTGLSQQTYYYKIWSYDETSTYSNGVEINATPLMPEPTNDPTDFIVTATTSTTISLSWTDVSSGVIPAAYLIKASTGAIIDPIDGTPEVDALLVKNVLQGVESVTFDGLTHATDYYFQIYPYSNSNINIDYKVDAAQFTT